MLVFQQEGPGEKHSEQVENQQQTQLTHMAPGQNGGGGGERYLVLYPEEDSNVETSVPEDF